MLIELKDSSRSIVDLSDMYVINFTARTFGDVYAIIVVPKGSTEGISFTYPDLNTLQGDRARIKSMLGLNKEEEQWEYLTIIK